ENVAVPMFYDELEGLTWLTSYTWMEDPAIEPDLAVDVSGHRHVVWEGSPFYRIGPAIYYEGNATPGAALTGAQIAAWGSDPSIAIDPNDGHVAVAFSAGSELRVTTNSSGNWNSESISSYSPPPRNSSIAIDSASNTHVVWQAGCDESD